MAISSPWAQRGLMYERWKRHHGRDGDPVLTWVAPSAVMNPTLDPAAIAEALADDPTAARTEWEARWREDITPFLSEDQVAAVVVPNRRELPPQPGVRYVGFLDPSGGSQDSFTAAVAHREERDGGTVVVLDALLERVPPFDPERVVAEVAALLAAYGVTVATSDKYAGVWVPATFLKPGIRVEQSAAAKSELYAWPCRSSWAAAASCSTCRGSRRSSSRWSARRRARAGRALRSLPGATTTWRTAPWGRSRWRRRRPTPARACSASATRPCRSRIARRSTRPVGGRPCSTAGGPATSADPLGFVLSKNLHRRHLTESERGLVAARITNLSVGRPAKENGARAPISVGDAAALLQTNRRQVQRAAYVRKHAPDLHAQVKAGTRLPACLQPSTGEP
ncbi:MAG: hypothetical protein U0807_03455 [Candidatus Binatia bacterium]